MTPSLPERLDRLPEKPTAAPPSPAWTQLLFPSVADILFVVLVFSWSCGSLASRLLGDAGIGWHIRNGELILQTHSITRTDPFSSTMQGQPWYAWEWLYDVLIATIHHWMGLNGVVLFTAILIAVTFALTFCLMQKRGGSLPASVIVLLLAAGASTIHFLARPHVVSWLFLLVWFCVLDSSETKRETVRRLFWLPVLTVFWVNLHGGFLLSFALLGIYLVSAAIRWVLSPAAKVKSSEALSLRRLAKVTAACLLASLINPYGYKLHVHVYQYLTNRFLMNHIDEFLSPNFHGVAQQCFALLLLISLLALVVRRGPLRPSQLFIVLFAAYGGLYASRNLPSSSILLCLVIAPWLGEGIAEAAASENIQPWLRGAFGRCQSFAVRMESVESGARWHLWPVAALLFLCIVAVYGGKLGEHRVMDAQFSARRFPVQAVQVIGRQGIRGPIFCPDFWGGYLIYRLYPQTKVVLDDRHDLYGAEFLKDYLKVIHVEPGWDRVLAEKDVNWVLVPSGSPLANILKESSAWTALHEDATALLFKRNE
jgi:hypothetical protein